MIIDWQHHFLPPEIYQSGGTGPGQTAYQDGRARVHFRHGKETVRLPEEICRVDKHLEFMDAVGIDVAVLSYTAVTSLQDCKLIDDTYGNIMREYPKRFVGLASCIPTIGSEALEELDRAISIVGLRGVVITPQIEGLSLDSEQLWPFYDMVSKLKIPVFVHPTPLSLLTGYNAFDARYDLYSSLVREFDLANATARIILGGVLTEFPDVKFVIAHMGGGISAVLERLVKLVNSKGEKLWSAMGGTPPFDEPLGDNFNNLFKRLYFDMAGCQGGMNTVRCALTTIGPERLLFALDYPFNFNNDPQTAGNYIENIKKLGLPSKSVALMLGGNAADILGV